MYTTSSRYITHEVGTLCSNMLFIYAMCCLPTEWWIVGISCKSCGDIGIDSCGTAFQYSSILCKCQYYLNVSDIGKKEGGAGYEDELEEEVKCQVWMWKWKLNIMWLSRSEPEQLGLAPEPEPLHHISCWSWVVSGPSWAVTTLNRMNILQLIYETWILLQCSSPHPHTQ